MLWPAVERALAVLRDEFELVVAEGAGAAVEPNLRAADIVNLRVARHTGAAVLLVGDIDRGGVFAHLLGTMALLSAEERALVRGFVLNRFRGDPALLAPAITELEQRTGVPVLGVVPWLDELGLAEEDAVALERRVEAGSPPPGEEGAPLEIAVVHFPRIANYDDFDPLAGEPGVRVRYIARPQELGRPALVVLPGTKATLADLEWLRASGLAAALLAYHAAGGALLGICGGFQKMGRSIDDPEGIEGEAGRTDGLGFLPVETTLSRAKRTCRSEGALPTGQRLSGYEIHVGETRVDTGTAPFCTVTIRDGEALNEAEGARSGAALGTYLHGLFDEPEGLRALLAPLRPDLPWDEGPRESHDAWRQRQFDLLGEHLRGCLDVQALFALVGLDAPSGGRPTGLPSRAP